jgi:hypothetical protein
MKMIMALAAALGVTMLGGCASYSDGYYGGYYGGYYDYGYYGYDGRGGHHHHRGGGGRSEPGNEAGMFPGRPGDGRGGPPAGGGPPGGGGSRGGEAGSR